ncbi:MAG: transporter substrate-binding domain-containing protein, partial [Spirochaetales bacterium]|nr:transporter substrate-binding domain-containing protein [Spirochaetales bacterium]
APWPIILEKAKTRQLDGIPAILPVHGKTLDLDTTIPVYFNSTPTAYTLEQSPRHINAIEDIAGSTVVVIKGMAYAQTFLKPIKDTITIIEVNSSPEAFALLLNKEADVFLGLNLDYYTITKRFIVGVKPAKTFWDATFNVYMGVRNDEPLLISALQKANASLTSDEISTIRRRWLEIPQEELRIIFTPKEQEFIKQHPTVQLGIDLNYAPFEFMNKDKGHQGLTADFLNLISSVTGLIFHPNPNWDKGNLDQQIEAKKIDLLSLHIKNATPAPPHLLLSDPIIEVPLVILARQGTDFIASIDNIINQHIGVVQGYFPEEFMRKTYPQATLIPYNNLADGLKGLTRGSCDFFIETLPQANHIIHTEGLAGITLVGQTGENIEFCFAIRKDLPELQTIINKTLAAIPLEQKLHLRQKLTNLTIPQHTNWQPILHISLMAMTILTIMVIWNRRLHQEIKARQKAESSLQLAQLTLDNIPLHIFWFDENFRVAMANKNAMEITGLSLEELNSTTAWELDPSFNKEQRHVVWNKVHEKKSIEHLGHLKIRDGSIIPTEASLTYIQTPEGHPYVVSIGTDITTRNLQDEQLKDSERKLKEALIKANESSRLKSEFLSNMSHEIRTPLNAIIGYSEMLSQGDLPTNKQRYAQTIIKSGKTLISLINDIIDLSKMEAGKMAICPVAINPQLFFENISQIFEPALQENKLDLKIAIDPNLPKVLTLDEVRLRQVLFNILGNAIKFTQTGYVKLAVTYTPTKPTFGTLTIAI